ncbi:DUF2020 domain-containing protein [Klenkia sp. LSe6-5]|uniref:DUF2020 domain-containing protein n=1 Tax=Klenkia sesuvii TaxID=3103137 RepID=A0ABU8DS38_9ACTN
MSRRTALLPTLAPVLALVLAACGGPGDDSPAGTAPATPAATASPPDAASPTGAAPSSPPPATTPVEPVTTEQDCPYLDTAFVQDTVGQQTPTVTTTGVPGGPPPGCTFAKPNGEAALTVEITQAADAVSARTAAVERVAAIGGTAVDDIGDGGGVAVGQPTVLAVADGLLVVVVTINQQSSLQAREIAQAVVGAV